MGKYLLVIISIFAIPIFAQTISFDMEQYGVSDLDTAVWEIDSGHVIMESSRTVMFSSDRISLTNTDSIPINFGLLVEGVYDSLNNPVPWTPGYWFDVDRFTLLARFEEVPIVPDVWSRVRDYLRDHIQFASGELYGVFGPSGYNMGTDSTAYLFLQFEAPLLTSICGDLTIVVRLYTAYTTYYDSLYDPKIILIRLDMDCGDIVYSDDHLPAAFAISAYPNPFNSSVTISLDSRSESPEALSTSPPGACRVEVFDINGRRISVIPDPDRESRGTTEILDSRFHGNDKTVVWQTDASLGSGVYLVRAQIGEESASKRIVYLK